MIRAFTIVVVVCALSVLGLQPAQAAATTQRAGTTTATDTDPADYTPADLATYAAGISWSDDYATTRGSHAPLISLGGCGFLQNCLFFNHTDQKAILAGASAGVAAAICIVGSPAACVVAAAVVAIALVYLDNHGICGSNKRLRVRWFPAPGGATCVK